MGSSLNYGCPPDEGLRIGVLFPAPDAHLDEGAISDASGATPLFQLPPSVLVAQRHLGRGWEAHLGDETSDAMSI